MARGVHRDAKGIRIGLRRAMAQMIIMALEAEASIEPGSPANVARRARAAAYRKAYREINRMLLWPDMGSQLRRYYRRSRRPGDGYYPETEDDEPEDIQT